MSLFEKQIFAAILAVICVVSCLICSRKNRLDGAAWFGLWAVVLTAWILK